MLKTIAIIIYQYKFKMESSELSKTTAKESKYTLEKLLNDILDSSDDNCSEVENTDKTAREQRAKKVVIQMLIEQANAFRSDMYKNAEKLTTALEVKVKEDKWMSGYMFYVSQNPNYDYSWNYMRKQVDGYVEFLGNAVRFFKNVVDDINAIADRLISKKDVHVVFGDIIEVASTQDSLGLKSSVSWERLKTAANFNPVYQITVKVKEIVLMIGTRNGSTDAAELIEKAIKLFDNKAAQLK